MTVCIGYDNLVFRNINQIPKNTYLYTGRSVAPGPIQPSYYFDAFTDAVYPLNGAHIKSNSYEKMCIMSGHNSQAHLIPLTQPDFHSSLPAVLLKNNINYTTDATFNLIQNNKKFIYSFTLRYFYFEHFGTNSKLSTINKNNYLKELLSEQVINEYNKGNTLILLNDVIEGTYYTDKILNTLIKNFEEIGIKKFNNIILVSSNPQSLLYNNKPFKIIYWQYFETATQLLFKKKNVYIDYQKRMTNTQQGKAKKFLFLNNKPRPHRFYLFYKIWKNNDNFNKDFCSSCRHRGETLNDIFSQSYEKNSSYIRRVGSSNTFKGLSGIDKELFNGLYKKLPITSQYDKILSKEKYYNFWDIINNEMYNNTNIHIITETLVEHLSHDSSGMLFLTEKIFKPIACKAPFILYGQHNSLKFLQSQGYKTFANFWSEEYDNIIDPVVRANEITKVVHYIQNLNNDNFLQLIKEIQPIVEHNYNIFISRIPEQDLLQSIKEFYNND